MSYIFENWLNDGPMLYKSDYSITTTDDEVYRTWWRPPLSESILVGEYEDVEHAQVAAEAHHKGRQDARDELRNLLGF